MCMCGQLLLGRGFFLSDQKRVNLPAYNHPTCINTDTPNTPDTPCEYQPGLTYARIIMYSPTSPYISYGTHFSTPSPEIRYIQRTLDLTNRITPSARPAVPLRLTDALSISYIHYDTYYMHTSYSCRTERRANSAHSSR